MSDHVPVTELADEAAGLLDPARQTAIRQHVQACQECTTAEAELAAVTALLAAEPAPAMPDEVFARLGTVVQGESARRASGEAQRAEEDFRQAEAKRTALGTFGENTPLGDKAGTLGSRHPADA
ncbi:MAG: hypothetical protein ACTH2Q_14600 [Propionibacteriaceae bacterium]